MSEEYEVIDGLRVVFVEEDGDHLHVDLYGGVSPTCGSVQYTFPDAAERAAQHAKLTSWAANRTVITIVRRKSRVTLVDAHALLRSGLGEPGSAMTVP